MAPSTRSHRTSSVYASAVSAESAHSRSASSRSASRRWNDSFAASRFAACMNACLAYWRLRASPSIHGSEASAPVAPPGALCLSVDLTPSPRLAWVGWDPQANREGEFDAVTDACSPEDDHLAHR